MPGTGASRLALLAALLATAAAAGEGVPPDAGAPDAPPAATAPADGDAPVAAADADDRQGLPLEDIPLAEAPPPASDSLWIGTLRWLERVRDARSVEVGQLGRYVDSWFASEDVSQLPNKSYVRISAKATASELENRRREDYSIRLKLDLPGSKRRWKLFFESDDTSADRLDEKVRNVVSGEGHSVGGLRLESDRDRNWLVDTDIGIRARIPLDPFARIKVQRHWALGNPWTLSFVHEDWYYHEKGFGTETSFDFHRPLAEDYYLSIVTAAQFQDRYDILELAQSATVTHLIDDRQVISYGIGMLGVNKPSLKSTAYYVSANYQRRIHKDWLFVEVTPELLFPRTEAFRPKWSLTVEFKAILTDP